MPSDSSKTKKSVSSSGPKLSNNPIKIDWFPRIMFASESTELRRASVRLFVDVIIRKKLGPSGNDDNVSDEYDRDAVLDYAFKTLAHHFQDGKNEPKSSSQPFLVL
jgi:hypothetical protein